MGTLTNSDVTRLAMHGSLGEVRTALAQLVSDKLDIETQLADEKAFMLGERTSHMEAGDDARLAQIKATGAVDHDWRSRAIAAVKIKDRHITRLNERIRTLTQTANEQASETQRIDPKAYRDRKTVPIASTGRSLSDFAADIDEIIADGWSVVSVVPHPDGVALVLRLDYQRRQAGQ